MEFAMITAPREDGTIHECCASLFASGYDGRLTVFAEPGSETVPHHTFFNGRRLGALQNFDQALKYLIRHSKGDRFCVLSDDLTFEPDFISDLPLVDCISLLTFERYNVFNQKYWFESNAGWGFAGGPFIFSRRAAEWLIINPIYIEHLKKSDRQIDAIVGKVMKKFEIPIWLKDPSVCDHIGYSSTLGHQWENHSTFKLAKDP